MPPMRESILVVDDELGMCRLLKAVLGDAGYRVSAHHDPGEALKALERERFDLVISDVRMPRLTGVDVLKAVKARAPETPVILVTAFGSTKTAVEAMKLGTSDFVAKPFRNEEIRLAVEAVLERRRLAAENDALRRELAAQDGLGAMAGTGARMKEAFRLISGAALSDLPALFVGEPGTGRSLAARTLHLESARAAQPFVELDCASLSEKDAADRLAGRFEGVFAGRGGGEAGAIAAAHRGSLFLRDVDALPPSGQAVLVRYLQDGKVRRQGSVDAQAVDARVIASAGPQAGGALRPDLRRRLAPPILLPALRERKEDIPVLSHLLCARAARRLGRPAPALDADALAALASREWPGNVAELEAVISRACGAARERIGAADLEGGAPADAPRLRPFRDEKQEVLETFERSYLKRLMSACDGNVTRAAAAADMDRKNLYDLLKKHGLRAE